VGFPNHNTSSLIINFSHHHTTSLIAFQKGIKIARRYLSRGGSDYPVTAGLTDTSDRRSQFMIVSEFV